MGQVTLHHRLLGDFPNGCRVYEFSAGETTPMGSRSFVTVVVDRGDLDVTAGRALTNLRLLGFGK